MSEVQHPHLCRVVGYFRQVLYLSPVWYSRRKYVLPMFNINNSHTAIRWLVGWGLTALSAQIGRIVP